MDALAQVLADENKNTTDNINNVTDGGTPIANPQDSSSTDQIRRLGEKVEKTKLPPDLKQLLIERIARLALIRQGSGFMSPAYITEYEGTSTYINWAVGLPWDKQSQDILDLVKAKQILDKNHYGIENVKNAVLEYLSTIILNSRRKQNSIAHAPILCLIGLAGTGKTTLAESIAESMGRKFERIPFGGMSDSLAIRGQSRVFPDAEPGAVVKNIIKASTKNPVILLDELDRVTEGARGDIMGVLLELLDPGQNKAFTDHYIDYPFDLSNVLFIATGNNTTNISTAVLDRMQILQMPSYSDEEKIAIARTYLFDRIRDEVGLTDKEIIINDDIWPHIVRPLGYDSGIRSLERTVAGMCRKAARVIVEGNVTQVHITNENVKQFLPSW
jgi:ATP-dependent Lon protease